MPKANWFLGIRIIRNRATKQLWLYQDSYIDKITIKFHLNEAKKTLITPLPVEKVILSEEEVKA
jgi:hypothetical protein